jgi:MoaA/NifB/PqqE/SkfB family radical SAM enzyme
MEQVLKHDLYKSFLHLEKDINEKWPLSGNKLHVKSISKREFVENAAEVCDILKHTPYLAGESVSQQAGLGRDQLAVIYKLIQRSSVSQDYFRRSKNKDYFNVVNHYFNDKQYTLVFFVGTSCPSRCIYCPNVKTDRLGRRRLVTYGHEEQKPLTENDLNRVFDDLAKIRDAGNHILIKISGGLEPLTDIPTLSLITRLANKMDLPVKLFTNGLLLDDPNKRKAALETGDIRISLSSTDEEQYRAISFSQTQRRQTNRRSALSQLLQSIQKLVLDRQVINPTCKIGFNSIILPGNHMQVISMLELARDLKLDYIDFKPDYYSSYPQHVLEAMDASIKEAKIVASHESYKDLFVNFTSSLSRGDLYWNTWSGTCNALKQSDFKMFITPFGHCCPVHYGAFPHSATSFNQSLGSYSIGEIDDSHGLLDIMHHPARTPEIELSKLNPFELMLNLEIAREEKDKTWGLPGSVSPYHTQEKDRIPADLFFRFSVKK